MEARKQLRNKKRILVKAGTGVVTDSQGFVSLGRIGHIVEQLSALRRDGKEVILVSSGAIAIGKQKLHEIRPATAQVSPAAKSLHNPRACAAAGQSGLMGLYDTLFRNKNIWCSQILLTDEDFLSEERRANLRNTIEELLNVGAIPILNENDVISTRKTPYTDENNAIFWDNDSLSALVASETKVDLVILLTDVEGLYRQPPTVNRKGEIIRTYRPHTEFTIGKQSRDGRGGMQAKIDAALYALSRGVFAVVIASGYQPNSILQVVEGKLVGTLFVTNPEGERVPATHIAAQVKNAQPSLLSLTSEERSAIIAQLATGLLAHKKEILAENLKDLQAANKSGLAPSLKERLKLSEQKLETLAVGLKHLSSWKEPIGQVLKKVELSPGIVLQQLTVPLGVVLVIFESRPDVLPQVAALCLKSGNGLVLKGGKEAIHTNRILHRIIGDTVESATGQKISRHVVGMVETHEDVEDLLQLEGVIDLVIPRGSTQLVRSVLQHTKIPVIGHTEGICHVYVDQHANLDKAIKIVVDAKIDYPAACNAAETLLLHRALLHNKQAHQILNALAQHKATLFGGPHASSIFNLPPVESFKKEYGSLSMSVEVVDSAEEAIIHINKFGSGHTDAIVTEDEEVARQFVREVDSACVFHNASTRFADGYRFGLGAEVGISTSKIGARGPVGLEGLMCVKWVISSLDPAGSSVAEFTQGKKSFTHRHLPLDQDTLKPRL
jgi:delta-1-pyrroline-5-carboxylate synthetase